MSKESEAARDAAFYRCVRSLLDAIKEDDALRVLVQALDPIEAKLDALMELVEAIGAAVIANPHSEPHKALARLIARRRGQCENCFGRGRAEYAGMNLPCDVCNGTGKPNQGDPDAS